MLKNRVGKFSWRMKRFFVNLGYRFRAMGVPQARAMKPSTTLLVFVMMFFVVFILAGGVFDILEKPLALLPRGSGWTFVYRGSINVQTLNESILAGLLYFLGVLASICFSEALAKFTIRDRHTSHSSSDLWSHLSQSTIAPRSWHQK